MARVRLFGAPRLLLIAPPRIAEPPAPGGRFDDAAALLAAVRDWGG